MVVEPLGPSVKTVASCKVCGTRTKAAEVGVVSLPVFTGSLLSQSSIFTTDDMELANRRARGICDRRWTEVEDDFLAEWLFHGNTDNVYNNY